MLKLYLFESFKMCVNFFVLLLKFDFSDVRNFRLIFSRTSSDPSSSCSSRTVVCVVEVVLGPLVGQHALVWRSAPATLHRVAISLSMVTHLYSFHPVGSVVSDLNHPSHLATPWTSTCVVKIYLSVRVEARAEIFPPMATTLINVVLSVPLKTHL